MSNIVHIPEELKKEFRVNEKGETACSIRGLARMFEVHHAQLSRHLSGEQRVSKLAETLMEQGFEGGDLTSWSETGVPDVAIPTVAEYYAFDAKQVSDETRNAARNFIRVTSAIGVRTWFQKELGFEHGDTRDALLSQVSPMITETLSPVLAKLDESNSKYFVTGLFQSGLYLVVAQAKSGKSLLGYDLSNSLCRGLPFLKRKTVRTNVLIVQNEEELSSTGRKIENNGLQELQRENPEEYQALIESHRLIVTKGLDINVDREKIINIIDEYSIGALIVDSFRASIGKGGLTEYDIGAASALYQLQSAVHERSMLCVVIHHANKSDNNTGKTAAFNGVGGHNALTGANDGVIKLALNPDKRVDGKETIDINFFPRNDNPCKFNVLYSEGEACKWGFEVLDESTLSDAMVANICSILMALDELYREWLGLSDEERPELVPGKSIDQLVYDTGIERPLLIKILNYMEQNEALGRYSQGRKWMYHIPAEGSELYYLLEENVELTDYKEKVENYPEFAYLLDVAKSEIEPHEYLEGVSCREYILANHIPLSEEAWCTLSRRTASFYRSTKGADPKRRGSQTIYYNKDVAYIVATLRLIMKGL